MAIEIDDADVVSNPLTLKVRPPHGYDEELVAQDVFTTEAGRVMAFDGSMVMASGVEAWQELVARLPESRAAVHARVALAMPMTRDYRLLRVDAPMEADALCGRGAFEVVRQKPEEGRQLLSQALTEDTGKAVQTLGRVDFEIYSSMFDNWLDENGADRPKADNNNRRRNGSKRARNARHREAAE